MSSTRNIWIFMDDLSTPTPQNREVFIFQNRVASQSQSTVSKYFYRKENSVRGLKSCLQKLTRRRQCAWHSAAILSSFPFGGTIQRIACSTKSSPLGPAHPCPNNVHMEPFSSSVFIVLKWILATSTKICTLPRSVFYEESVPHKRQTPSYSTVSWLSVEYKHLALA